MRPTPNPPKENDYSFTSRAVDILPPVSIVIVSDLHHRAGGIIIDEKYDTSKPTGRLQKLNEEIRQAAITLGSNEVYESVWTALDTVSSWDLEECLDIDDLINELENEAEWFLDKAATRRAEEELEIQQLALDFVTISATVSKGYLKDLENGDASWNDVEWDTV